MRDEPDNTNPKLASWLRQWGAARACDEAAKRPATPRNVDAAPVSPVAAEDAPTSVQAVSTPRRSVWPGIRRWAPLAAAAVLLLVWGWLLADREKSSGPEKSSPGVVDATATKPTEPTDRETQLAAQLDAAWQRVSELEQTVEIQQVAMKDLVEIEEKANAAARQQAADRATIRALDAEVNRLGEALANEQATRAEVQTTYMRLHVRFDAQRDEIATLTTTLAIAQRQLEQSQEALAAAVASREEAQADLARAESAAEQMRRLYLAALADSSGGVSAARQAVVNGRFLQRLAVARRQADSGTVALLDRIEVAAMSLSALRVDDARAVEAFRKQMAAWQLEAAVAKALQANPPAAVRTMLVETQLLLTEADRDR